MFQKAHRFAHYQGDLSKPEPSDCFVCSNRSLYGLERGEFASAGKPSSVEPHFLAYSRNVRFLDFRSFLPNLDNLSRNLFECQLSWPLEAFIFLIRYSSHLSTS